MARIFICYRRDDTSGHAGRLYDRLRQQFGDEVFMDIGGIGPGVDYAEVIDDTIGSIEVALVMIGRNWLNARDETGRRRLESPHDLVHEEIAQALARDVLVIPVLVEDATLPTAEELPSDLASLARRNAIELSDERWSYDTDRLCEAIEAAIRSEFETDGWDRRRNQRGGGDTFDEDTDADGGDRRWLLVGGLAFGMLVVVLAINLWPGEVESVTTTDDDTQTNTTIELATPPDTTYLAARFEEAPSIDGIGEDWASITSNRTLAVAEGEDDPSVVSDWKFGWDETGLYLFVEVADPDPLSTPYADEPALLYRGDGINMIFGPDPTGLPEDIGLREDEDIMILIGPSSADFEDIVVAKRVRAESSPEAAGDYDCENTYFAPRSEKPQLDAAIGKTEVGYSIEAEIPWDELLVAPEPLAGAEFGIIFTVAHAGDGSEENRRGSRSSHMSRLEAKHCPGKWNQTIGLAP